MRKGISFKKLVNVCKEYQYEYDTPKEWDFWRCNRITFWIRQITAWLFNLECEHCDNKGMNGYYEREACSYCDGFALRWQFSILTWIRQNILNLESRKNWEERYFYEEVYFSVYERSKIV